ncbi:hypothetical protein jhhlp_001914 [Lomentospora prolificans]|uniref:WAC domain-containing protein n=1 Tax=Lomentospora prolificans TaxID=41688 RepID=A0A2N3NCI2_9PEZI|nr:hypothetical protein jhhlp_001914 [Lomentospora prolificans]
MVLFKRKPVVIPPPQEIKDKNAQVWYIPQTGEIFATYEEYLSRIDFYKQRRFICQITGQSRLNFFDALKSEQAGAKEVEQAFPEALKGPVLRKVQFQTVSRIDTLVDKIYDEFRADYYPGEAVTVEIFTGEKLQGVVRDKTRFGSKQHPDGSISEPFSRYFVSLDDRPDEEAVVDDHHISRDRKIFTKSVLRSFIKRTVTREAWTGAPWLVKHEYATMYHIDTRVPVHLRYDTKLQERKLLAAQKKALHPTDANGVSNHQEPVRLPELKPAPKSHKAKAQQPGLAMDQQAKKGKDGGKFAISPDSSFQFPTGLRNGTSQVVRPATPPPPPPPKYPIEDLQVGPRAGVVRPKLHFLCNNPPTPSDAVVPLAERVNMDSVGPLLETWDTLNVYCEIFILDSFTFDDYVEALCVTSEEVPTQLLDEIHCGILKILVRSEEEGGKVEITLPEIEEEDDEEDDDDEDGDATPTPEPEPQPTKRATRSSLAKIEAERLAAEAAEAERLSQAEKLVHRAEELLEGYDWIEQLRKRDFKNGGWEMILVGLLYQLSKDERKTELCEKLLGQLVPPNVDPSQQTVIEQYANMDVNFRVQIIQLLCMLTMETKAVRGYMEDCSEQMTTYRKGKIEWQRQRKQALEELKALNEQRKILLPDNMPPSPPPETDKEDVKMTDAPSSPTETHATEDSEDETTSRRGLRRARDRAAEREKRRQEEIKKKEEAELAAKAPKQSKQFIKLLKDIQQKEDFIKNCEDEIAVFDNDIREADCPRTRVLGKDRFWNRYYWFERNGMPYGGLPDSSTAHAGYANGCIWVQGPDDMEREGYIDLPTQFQNEYKAKFNMTVPERKKREEGATSVYTAHQWGFYSEPEEVEELLNWLDPRGYNELRLRKEILAYKEKIVQGMENRKAYLAPAKKEEEADDESKATRMSTRTRARQTQTPEPPSYRCLSWENTMAVDQLGHVHMDPPPPPKSRKQSRKRGASTAGGPPRKSQRR